MIRFVTGNVQEADAEAVVNSVNCVGFMGRGVALQFKKAWPENFSAYAAACRRGEVQPGKMFVFETGRLTNPRYIVNFPTKRHWRGKSRIEEIEAGLRSLAEEIRARGIRSIALPPLGCGLGGLHWPDVRRRIAETLGDLDQVDITVCEPSESVPLPKSMRRSEPARMTPGRAARIGLMELYLRGLLDPFVSLLELHKLMCFMQKAGEPLRLRFAEGPCGPYAENLRHVLHAIEGYYVSGCGAGGNQPGKVSELVPGAVDDARRAMAQKHASRERRERVGRLVEGFESPYGLELLATVLWIVTSRHPNTADVVVSHFYRWAPRKQRFSRGQIFLALRVLEREGWTAALPGRRASE